MSVVACDLYRIEVSKKDSIPVLTELELLKVFEPVKPLFPIESQFYQSFLQNVSENRQIGSQAIQILFKYSDTLNESEKTIITQEFSKQVLSHSQLLRSIATNVIEKQDKLASLTSQIQATQTQIDRFEVIKDVALPLFVSSELVRGTVLVIDKRYVPAFQRSLKDITSLELSVLAETTEATVYAAVYETQFEENMKQLIAQSYCQEILSPDLPTPHSPAQAYEAFVQKKNEMVSERTHVETQLRELSSQHLLELVAWHDLLLLQESSLHTLEYVGYTPGSKTNTREIQQNKLSQELVAKSQTKDSLLSAMNEQGVVHIDGWIDPREVPVLKARLESLDVDLTFTQLSAENDPEARTVLHNNRLLRPFEVITNLMGMPSGQEIDPSPYVAPFFVLFFGFALGDAGYGLLMVAFVAYFYRKRLGFSRQLRNALALMLYCGISTTIFGVITGSWFGVNLDAIGKTGDFLASLKVLDLQSNILLLLAISLLSGFIHQLFGLVLAVKSTWQAGRVAEAIQLPGTWLLLLVSLAFAYAITNVPQLNYLIDIRTPLLAFAGLAFIFGQGYGSVWWMRPFKGMLSIFNLTSYLSNTLSYARLLALALATGVIASVVNMIAVMAGGSLPLIPGLIVMGIVAIIGHAFNILLNLMGTFINVARLHLVEFFPRFFEAKGIGLVPLHNEPMYSFFSETFSTKDMSFDQFKAEK